MEETEQTLRWISGIEPPQEVLSATGTQILEIECREQPARLHELIQAYGSDPGIRNELKKFRDLAASKGPVLFIGMGASCCSSISGAIFSAIRWKTVVFRGCRRVASLRVRCLGRCNAFGVADNVRGERRTGGALQERQWQAARFDLQQPCKHVLESGRDQTPDSGWARVRQCHQDIYERYCRRHHSCLRNGWPHVEGRRGADSSSLCNSS